jgi:UDP-N-acetylmuramoylalanine--D-glutamate ligase
MSNKEYRISKREIFIGKNVLVMGLGRFGGGVDVAEFAVNNGAKVIITDLLSAKQLGDSIDKLKNYSGIEYHLGGHCATDFEQADIIIVNPAVPADNEFLKIARRHNKSITSQINIFFELCHATVIGITGANGKSTTAALTAHLLRSTSDEHVWLSGNIGNEPLLAVIDQIAHNDLVVLELSSFQLERLAQIAKGPKVALLTNLTPNHLDRHGTFANYCAAKENIFKFQKLNENDPAVSIFNAEDKIGAEWFEKYKGDKGRVCIKFSTDGISEEIRSQFSLPGRANLSNLAGAVAIARHFGIEDDQIKSCLPEFKSLSHRLELVAKINGVCWYNDSIATTPESAIAAIDAFESAAGGKIIIAGGYDKNLPFDQLGAEIAKNTKAAILIGQTADKIAGAIQRYLAPRHALSGAEGFTGGFHHTKIKFADSLTEAVDLANRLAVNGDVVLLSPGCASYDMFDNFEQRGREFIKLVRKISG